MTQKPGALPQASGDTRLWRLTLADSIVASRRLKRKTETEVERAEIFELVRVRIYTVIEANRPDRQLVTQTSTNRVAHVVQPDVLRRRQQIASVSKYAPCSSPKIGNVYSTLKTVKNSPPTG